MERVWQVLKWCATAAVLYLPLNSMTQEIPADLSANKWSLSSSRFECRLSNYVPGGGTVTVVAEAGNVGFLSLTPDPWQSFTRDISITLADPPWQHTQHVHHLATAHLSEGQPLTSFLNVPYAVESMREGLQLVIDIQRPDLEPVTLKIPTLNFSHTGNEFYYCFSQLLALNFKQAEETVFFYTSGQHRLKQQDYARLEALADYVLADQKVERIEIDAHTDSLGSHLGNRQLSEKRGEYIRKKFRKLGIPEAKILARFHGERHPVASDSTEKGRKQNRRVKIRLIRR